MATFDVDVQSVLRRMVAPVCLTLGLLVLLRLWIRRLSRYHKARLLTHYDLSCAGLKKRLFRGLGRQAAALSRPLRVLEFGVRQEAANFDFYPNGCDAVCVTTEEPRRVQLAVTEDHPHVRLVLATQGPAADVLGAMTDDCYDAVIFSLALEDECLAATTLEETYRVLKPSGCCYFIERTSALKPSIVSRLLEWGARPLCALLGVTRGAPVDVGGLLQTSPYRERLTQTKRAKAKGTVWERLLIPSWNRWLLVGAAIK